jgi:hypothetical protein
MILENLGIPDITPQGIDRSMAANVHHFEDGGTTLCSAGQEARPQGMPGELFRIEAHALRICLDDIGNTLQWSLTLARQL